MIRSALLALDTSDASVQARDLAIRVCQEQAGRAHRRGRPIKLSGVAVVDRPTIERPEAAPIGGGGFKVDRDETLLADAKEKIDAILADFLACCRAADVPCDAIRAEGQPYEQIERAARSHDLILIGRDTNFHFETSLETGDTVRRLLTDNPRPLLITPDTVPSRGNVVIAYDGSNQSSHALHMWTLLDVRRDGDAVHVVSIAPQLDEAEARCEEAAALLANHDVEAECHAIESRDRVIDVLHQNASEWNPGCLVMGAFGAGGLRERFFGSETLAALNACPCPILLCQ